MKRSKFKKAFALSIVMWIVAALLFGMAFLTSISKDTVTLSSGVKNKLITNLQAQDVLESLKYYFLTADYSNKSYMNESLKNFVYKFPAEIVLDNRWYSLSTNIKFRVQDLSAHMNLFYLHPAEAAYIATQKGERQKRYIISDSIQDWSDKDNVPSLNGAEASTYKLKKHLNYKPRNNADIQHVEELRLINGFDKLDDKEWSEIKKLFYFGSGSMINLALVTPKQLSYFLKIDSSYAEALLKLKKEDMQKFVRTISAFETFDEEKMGFYISKEVEIEIVVTSEDAQTNLHSQMDFNRLNDKLYITYQYINN